MVDTQKLTASHVCFREVYDDCGEAVYELGMKLLAIVSEALGQSPDFLFSKIGNHEKVFMRTVFKYYPPCPQPKLVMGTPPHADICAHTILQQEMPGLQVLHDGVWGPVGSFDVIIRVRNI